MCVCVCGEARLLTFHQLLSLTVCLSPPPRLYVNWRFMRGIEAQFLALQKGFTELIPQHLLKPFDHKELEVNTPFLLSQPQINNHLEFSQ